MNTENLFSYGTLQQEEVQLATFGRKLTGTQDALVGYKLSMLKITNPHVLATSGKEFHPMVTFTGNGQDAVEGTVLEVTCQEILQADCYEVKDYKRVYAPLRSGNSAWVYVKNE
ncbi:MAG: gamma-glutamylcyclotransferase [Chthoniobacterales bacterium]|nr:gamma-glutamylcyclotransferase [Chthoniobacterales bacterium]